MYAKAKSCVKVNNSYSGYFTNNCGVRQGENLSPLLFALFLNYLKPYLLNYVNGLESFSKEAKNFETLPDEIDVLLQMFVLLYADDTVLCAESAEQLQMSLDKLYEYCCMWHLSINVCKTKIIVFSKGKIRKKNCVFVCWEIYRGGLCRECGCSGSQKTVL